jgi:Putative serine esterase (DUF676)
MTTFTVSYTDASGNQRTSATVTLQDSPNPSLPVVLLLHGNNGTADDMTNPAVHPGMDYDYLAPIAAVTDRGWHGYPNVGVWGFELDPLKGVTSWQAALATAGFGTAWYSQVDNAGYIATPARELAAVVTEILARLPASRRLALLAHSRGGLLARQFLVSNAANTAMRARLGMLITLHSPHLGSELASLANALNSALAASSLTTVAGSLFGWLQSQVNAPSYQEMAVGSTYLSSLTAAEAAVGAPVIPVYTFGGTSALLSRARSSIFTPGSAVPQVTSIWPPRVEFHWETTPLALPSLITGIAALGLLAPELRDTVGDLLVADARSRLPGERSHQANRLNHAEALWDSALQRQVIAALTAGAKTAKEGKEGKEKDKDRKEGDKLRKDDDKLRKDFDMASAPSAGIAAGFTPSGETGRQSFIKLYERPEVGRP